LFLLIDIRFPSARIVINILAQDIQLALAADDVIVETPLPYWPAWGSADFINLPG
jgi:hypothetical protein